MQRAPFKPRTCKHCGEALSPVYANQWVHGKCRKAARLDYQRRYQKEYQRKVRRELKMDERDET